LVYIIIIKDLVIMQYNEEDSLLNEGGADIEKGKKAA
jgi:hypothetical protein